MVEYSEAELRLGTQIVIAAGPLAPTYTISHQAIVQDPNRVAAHDPDPQIQVSGNIVGTRIEGSHGGQNLRPGHESGTAKEGISVPEQNGEHIRVFKPAPALKLLWQRRPAENPPLLVNIVVHAKDRSDGWMSVKVRDFLFYNGRFIDVVRVVDRHQITPGQADSLIHGLESAQSGLVANVSESFVREG